MSDLITPNRPKVKITRENRPDHPSSGRSRSLMKDAGQALAPFDFDYQASVCVHFYKQTNQELYAFIVHQTGLNGIPEPQADAGFKEMQRAMMSVYGRTPPKMRTDV